MKIDVGLILGLIPQFLSRMQVAFISAWSAWTPLMHVWFLLPTSIENVGKQKENVCN